MALKRNVYKFCQICGQKDAEVRNGVLWWGIHRCSDKVPGPSTPPRYSHNWQDSINFIRNSHE